MSNYLAIATVTATLGSLLYTAALQDVTDTQVVVNMLRPADIAKDPGAETNANINIYLYQVTPNAAYRNSDLPTRRSDGTVLQRPQVALDLHYIISFYGHESDYVTHRLLGSVVRTLHAEPQLTRERIRATLPTVVVNGKQILSDSNLADQVELVKFAPLHLSLEEFSRIWSVFYQIPYVLSVAYQASVVLIESEDIPQNALPVRQRNIYAIPFYQPIIEQIIEKTGVNQPTQPDPPITLGSTLLIRGKRLQAPDGDGIPSILINGVEVKPQSKNVSNTEITLPLTDNVAESDLQVATLRAGVQSVQVIHPTMMGTPPVAHGGVESNVAAFVLRPTLDLKGQTNFPVAGDATIIVQPPVSRTQRVVLLLNQFSPAPRASTAPRPPAYSFVAIPQAQQWQKNQDGEEITTDVLFSLKDIKPGVYLVRVQVNGAESLLTVNADGRFAQPQVTIP